MTKLQINKAQDAQGFRSLLEDSLGNYVAMMFMPGFSTGLEDKKRLRAVDLAGPRPARRALRPGRHPVRELSDGGQQAAPTTAWIPGMEHHHLVMRDAVGNKRQIRAPCARSPWRQPILVLMRSASSRVAWWQAAEERVNCGNPWVRFGLWT